MSIDIFLYRGELSPSDIILSDPTVPRTSGNMYFMALAASMSQFSATVNKKTSKFLSSLMSVFSGLFSASFVVPPPFVPVSVGQIVVGFGISFSNPSELDGFSSTTRNFFVPGPIQVSSVATPDGWGNLGQQAMAGQLLVAPGNGGLSDRVYYIMFGGDILIPADSINPVFEVVLSQNYFYPSGQQVTVMSDVLNVSPVNLVPGVLTNWNGVCKLSGNGSHNGILIAESSTGTRYSNRNSRMEPKLQLSLGVNLSGSSVSGYPLVRLMQFEIQQ